MVPGKKAKINNRKKLYNKASKLQAWVRMGGGVYLIAIADVLGASAGVHATNLRNLGEDQEHPPHEPDVDVDIIFRENRHRRVFACSSRLVTTTAVVLVVRKKAAKSSFRLLLLPALFLLLSSSSLPLSDGCCASAADSPSLGFELTTQIIQQQWCVFQKYTRNSTPRRLIVQWRHWWCVVCGHTQRSYHSTSTTSFAKRWRLPRRFSVTWVHAIYIYVHGARGIIYSSRTFVWCVGEGSPQREWGIPFVGNQRVWYPNVLLLFSSH